MSALGPDESGRWLPIAEAAAALHTTVDGLRKRIARGTLQSRKGNDGAISVLATEADLAGWRQDAGRTEELGRMAAEVRALRGRLRLLRAELRAAREAQRELKEAARREGDRADRLLALLERRPDGG